MSEKIIITIARQVASGGLEIGQKLSELLNIPLYDKDLIIRAAKESGYSERLFHQLDEQNTHSFLYSLVIGSNIINSANMTGSIELPLNERLFLIQSDIIKKIADEGSCIIVGRCADYILRDDYNATNVFIHADINSRIKRLMTQMDISESDARKRIEKGDKQRAGYYNYFAHDNWLDMSHYNITIDSSAIGADNAAEMIKNFAIMKSNYKVKN